MAATNCPQVRSVIQNCRKSTRTSAAPRASTKEDTSHDPTNADPLETPETDWHGGCRATTTGTGTPRRAALHRAAKPAGRTRTTEPGQRKQARLVKQARLKLQATVQGWTTSLHATWGGHRWQTWPREWLRRGQNLLITGPCGCGKTYLACALGYQACQQGHSTRYYRLPRLLLT